MKKAFVSGLALIAGLSLASAEGKILKAVSTECLFYRDLLISTKKKVRQIIFNFQGLCWFQQGEQANQSGLSSTNIFSCPYLRAAGSKTGEDSEDSPKEKISPKWRLFTCRYFPQKETKNSTDSNWGQSWGQNMLEITFHWRRKWMVKNNKKSSFFGDSSWP